MRQHCDVSVCSGEDNKQIRTLMPLRGHTSGELGTERAAHLCEAILESLSIASGSAREEQIVKSHADTFHWILEDGSFLDWLQSPNLMETFWITGLPGSGKSTLTRYIANHPTTRRVLGSTFHYGTFFFWESGTILQRSQTGLLRSLLHQLLQQAPTLVPSTFPELWSDIWEASTLERVRRLSSWDTAELAEAFTRFFSAHRKRQSCLFIDGLDEVEGDPSAIINLLSGIRKFGNVKICVSSRPWDVFVQAFRNTATLRLSDCTADDMKRFVRSHLHLISDTDLSEITLMEEIVKRAQGVFLWASLVVTLLRHHPDPALNAMHTRLNELPSGLDSLYHYLLIESSAHVPKFSQVTQLMRAREEVSAFTRDEDTSLVSFWEMILLMKFEVEETIVMDIKQASTAEVEKNGREVWGSVVLSSNNLIELQGISDPSDPERSRLSQMVTFVHRTVKDWLADPNVWKEVVSFAPHVRPHLAHLKAVVVSFKWSLDRPRKTRSVPAWWSRIVLAMTHARMMSHSNHKEAFFLLQELNRTLDWYWPSSGKVPPSVDSWARTCFGTYEERGQFAYEEPFLSLAVKFGVEDFVVDYLEDASWTIGTGKSPLQWSVQYLCNRQQSVYPLSSPAIVGALLDYGLAPNHEILAPPSRDRKPGKAQSTPWQATLEAIQQADRRGWIDPDDSERCSAIVNIFIQHGADLTVSIKASYKDQAESASALLRRMKDRIPNLQVLNSTQIRDEAS